MKKSLGILVSLTFVILVSTVTASWAAQNVEFESVLTKRQITCILEFEDRVIGGLDGGGLLYWDRLDPTQVSRLSAGIDLSGNFISDLAWTGRNIWVATEDGGMTRISNFDTEPEYRLFTSNLGGMDVTAVTGAVVGGTERVYYGMDAGGLGLLTDGIPGAQYTAYADGLIDDNINDLIFFEDLLYIATPSGICRFENNVFPVLNDGLVELNTSRFAIGPDGNLYAGTDGGVFVWNNDTQVWSTTGYTGTVRDLSANTDNLWVLGSSATAYYSGSSWTTVSLPQSQPYALCAGQNIWTGGRNIPSGMAGTTGFAWYAVYEEGTSTFVDQVVDGQLVPNPDGIAIGSDGKTWVGSRNGWAVSGQLGQDYSNIYEIASAGNDSTGLFNHWAPMLALGSDFTNSLIYVAQYSVGIVRVDLETGEQDLMNGNTCGLEDSFPVNSSIVNLTVHPDGTLLVAYDWAHDQKVRILTDPVNWRGSENWHDVLQGPDGGIGTGVSVWDILVARNDIIWFAVEGTGLVRWDVNGPFAGPDEEITWSDTSDDHWAGPFSDISGTSNDPTVEKTHLALAPDGTIWYGGNGVTRVDYEANSMTLMEDYETKTAFYIDGLINGNVADIATDAQGNLWVATREGLNRILWDTKEPEIEAYFDLGNYLSNPMYGQLYSFNSITNLPGGVYKQLAVSADGNRLAVSSTLGAVSWDVPEVVTEEVSNLDQVYIYPNPWVAGIDAPLLKLGGFAADATEDDPALVEVFNLEGQLVYKNSSVSSEVGFWNGNNRVGSPVSTGMYVLKVQWHGLATVRSLAIVR
ncbi:MAG: hypothetical protein GY780_15510 [bacterium]|nr:hypothetical protein [bacterium]